MFEGVYLVTLIGTAMVLAAAFSSLIAFRFGAPLLLLFLGIGLLAGQDGLGIPFDNASASYFIGAIALAVILFDSGFGTPLSSLRMAAPPAVSLATVGVILTAGLFGVFTVAFTDFDWLESFLLGSIIASTDAAAVFFLLRAGNLNIRERVRNTLEIESGSNDPIAIFLTLAFVEMIGAGEALRAGELALNVVVGFLREMGIGALAGLLGGRLIVMFVDRLKLDPGLLPIFVITLALMLFGVTGAVHGSGFVAVYIAGLVAGNSGMRSTATLKRFQDGISWLAQIIMFLVLGLFATPSQFLAIIPVAVVLSLFLIFVARPVAVSLCLLPFRFARAETAFISWVGLRGAVSILLALTPIIANLDNGRALFNIAFIIVLVSLLVQGWTIGPVARRLGLIIPPRSGPLDKVELELPGSAHHELLAYRVAPGSPVARGGRIPRWARPSLVIREGRSLKPQDAGRLMVDDLVYIFVSDRYPRLLDRLFATRVSLAADDEEFFGAFTVEPDHLAREISAAYGAELREGEAELTIAQLMLARLGGHAEYADRVSLGPIELIVRDTDDKGAIDSVGLALEPQELAPSMPLLLTAGEIRDRLAAFLRRRSAKTPGEPVP
ncbi:potassium/proton antiporter [Mesorhizobium sp. J428]|uniref:potassium/proton antiporter n=1 Tax=Mesorhizobium sp. J428 TaxID=2898440 RepID=UPI0021516003|nr:potassium/proton antiporter [Mesorhizobium sp. J428]MCR5856856.1 potassium/proton antiporter [Mesorhizobium sp. J428]